LKDLGKRWFAVSRMDVDTQALITKIDSCSKERP